MILGIPLLRQLSLRLLLVVITDLKQRCGEKKRHPFYSKLFSLQRCLHSVMLPCDYWKAHRNCKTKIPSCPSASHNIRLCVAQAEIQSAWEAEEQFGVQCWTKRLWVLSHVPCMLLVQADKAAGDTWCMRIKYIYALFWCDADTTLMTTKERTWKTSEELSVLLFHV